MESFCSTISSFFRTTKFEEMFTLFSTGVDLTSTLIADSVMGDLCFLVGSPLDFASQIGSEQAIAAIWPSLNRNSQRYNQEAIRHILPQVPIEPLVLDAIMSFATCNALIWERFVSNLSHKEVGKLKGYISSELDETNGGLLLFLGLTAGLSFSKMNNMLLHGPNYFQNLILHLSRGISFFTDVCGTEFDPNWTFSILAVTPDPDIHLALYSSIITAVDLPQLTGNMDFHVLFSGLILLFPQYPWLGCNIGQVLPRQYDSSHAMFDIFAATKINNMTAVRLVLERTSADGVCL